MGYYGNNDYRDFLAHHGILGMHWGIRRYQSYDVGYQRKGGEDGVERIYGSRSRGDNNRNSRKIVKKVVTAAALIGVGYWVGKHPDQAKNAASIVAKTLPKIGKKAVTTSVKGAKVTAKFVAKQAPKVAKSTVSGGKKAVKVLPKVGKNAYKGAKAASRVMVKVGKKTYQGSKAASKWTAKVLKKIAASGKTLKTNPSSIDIVNKAKNGGDSVYGVINAKKGGSSIRAVLRK